jgi:hypothetical protein
MSDIFDLLAIIGTLAISLAISVPLTGALVRLRANFNPRSIQLDAEGNVEPHTGPVVTTFFGMLLRVKRIEVRDEWLLFPSVLRNHRCRDGMGYTKDSV